MDFDDDGQELGTYFFSESGHAIVHEMGSQGPRGYSVIPARPAIVLRGLTFELALQGEEPSFDFGCYDKLGNIEFFACDADDEIVDIDPFNFFHGPNFETDPDHSRLLKYAEVADEESFASAVKEFVEETAPLALNGFCFECPAVATATNCANFPLEKLRVWNEASAKNWDGVTRVADLLLTGTLKSEAWDQWQPLLRVELQKHAAQHIIRNVQTYVEQQLLELRAVAAQTDATTQSMIEKLTPLLTVKTPQDDEE